MSKLSLRASFVHSIQWWKPKALLVLSRFSCVRLCAILWTVAHKSHLWDPPGKSTGVDCHALLQGIFSTQESNRCLLHLLHCRQILYPLNHLGSPRLNSDPVKKSSPSEREARPRSACTGHLKVMCGEEMGSDPSITFAPWHYNSKRNQSRSFLESSHHFIYNFIPMTFNMSATELHLLLNA